MRNSAFHFLLDSCFDRAVIARRRNSDFFADTGLTVFSVRKLKHRAPVGFHSVLVVLFVVVY